MNRKLHEMNPRGRFTDRASSYARFRPEYAAAAVDMIAATVSGSATVPFCDVGAGTGISTRLLESRGHSVVAIEPNVSMLALAPRGESSRYLLGSAESLPLRASSVEVVTSFNAFHWFSPDEALAEFHRVLVPSGSVCLVWNDWNEEDAFTRNYVRLVTEASHNHPAENRIAEVSPLYETSLFGDVEAQAFSYEHALDLRGLIGRIESTSYLPGEGPEYERLCEEVTRLHGDFAYADGNVRHVYWTRVYRAERLGAKG